MCKDANLCPLTFFMTKDARQHTRWAFGSGVDRKLHAYHISK